MQQNATDSVASGDVSGAEILPFGQQLGGRYEIREALGVGGYAVVYRAWDRDLKSEIALKVLRNDRSSPAAITRFRREANVARGAVSPHLLRIFDIAASGDGCFLTMELVRGESLRQKIARGPIPADEAVAITLQILEGLRALHALNIVHRDLKPENVLIAQDGTVKIADFGLAHFLDEEFSRATSAGALVGTTDYIPPEQALGNEADARADLYALGIVLFEMLTGKLPFARESSIGAVLARLRSRAPSLRSIRRETPLWLSSIVARLLEREPSRRYSSADEAARSLRSRRFDFPHILRPGALALPVILALCTWFSIRPAPRPEFARLAAVGDRGIAAISRDGKTLWERTNVDPDIASTYALARLEHGGPRLIATIFGAKDDFSAQRIQTLSFLDPLTGEVVRRVHIPDASDFFPHDPRRYAARSVIAADLDGDGVDEVIVSFQHVPEAPSYSVLYEPRLDRARCLFMAYGNHDFAAVHDLDGDGKPEVLFLGINNGFNWFSAIAAVRIDPWVSDARIADRIPSSPDFGVTGSVSTLRWYTLLPRGLMPNHVAGSITFDDARRRLDVHLLNGRTISVRYDGFLTDVSGLSPAQREENRRSAYAGYRESHRLFDGGFTGEAIAEARRAVDSASLAHDAILLEAMQRSLGKLMIATGDVDPGVRLLETIAAQSENASDIAFDAAVALHLHGDVARAVEWYRRGVGRGGSLEGGKSKHEFLQGIILALSELGRAREGLADYEQIRSAYSWGRDWTRIYAEYAKWRSGEMPSPAGIDIGSHATDVARYWLLEFRNSNGEAPEPLLRNVDNLIDIGDDPQCILWSLKAELLWRMGRKADAVEAIKRAKDLLSSERRRSVVAHAHASIIEERFARMTRERI